MDTTIIALLCLAAFVAGFIDAIVGGGGLVQTPAALVLLPQYAVSTIIGTLKIPAFSGTMAATLKYWKHISLPITTVMGLGALAFGSAWMGSLLLTRVSNDFMKPVLLVVLAAMAVYTFAKKDFGTGKAAIPTSGWKLWCAVAAIGFYDGFIGPGTGSFLILAFITLAGCDFLRASAAAKTINLSTNLGSIVLFILKGKIIWAIALPMAACNALGGWAGAKLAIGRGNRFIRLFFLMVVTLTLMRLAYDVLGR